MTPVEHRSEHASLRDAGPREALLGRESRRWITSQTFDAIATPALRAVERLPLVFRSD